MASWFKRWAELGNGLRVGLGSRGLVSDCGTIRESAMREQGRGKIKNRLTFSFSRKGA